MLFGWPKITESTRIIVYTSERRVTVFVVGSQSCSSITEMLGGNPRIVDQITRLIDDKITKLTNDKITKLTGDKITKLKDDKITRTTSDKITGL